MKQVKIIILGLFMGMGAIGQTVTPNPGPYQPVSTKFQWGWSKWTGGAWVQGKLIVTDSTQLAGISYSNVAPVNDSSLQIANTAWIRRNISPGAPGQPTTAWQYKGNYSFEDLITPDRTRGRLGFIDSFPLHLMTNNIIRLTIPDNGINRRSNAVDRMLVLDTVTKALYYRDIPSGGSGSGISQLGTGWGLIKVNDSTYMVDTSLVASLSALRDTAAAIRGDMGGGGIDSVRSKLSTDSILQFSGGVGSFAYRYPRVFNVKDYGATGDSSQNATPYIQRAIDSCLAKGGGTVYFPNGFYWLTDTLVTSRNGVNPNSQLVIPPIGIVQGRTHITFLGETKPNGLPALLYIDSGYSKTGVIIKTTITGSGIAPSIFGGAGVGGTFTFHNVSFKNLTIIVPANKLTTGPTMSGINGSLFDAILVEDCLIGHDASYFTDTLPRNETAGIITPIQGADLLQGIRNTLVFGFRYGMVVGEHVNMENTFVSNCYASYVFQKGVHPTVGTDLESHWSVYDVLVPNTTIMGNITSGSCKVNILNLTTEPYRTNSRWFTSVATVVDTGHKASGVIRAYNVHPTSGSVGPSGYVQVGGNNLKAMALTSQNIQPYPFLSLSGTRDFVNSKIDIGKGDGSGSPYKNIGINDAYVAGYGNNLSILSNAGNINFAATASTAQMTLAPTGTLSVNSNSTTTVANFNNASGSGNMVVNFNSGSNTNTNVVLQNASANQWYFGNTGAGGVNTFRLLNSDANSNVERFTLLQSGRMGLSTVAPTAMLHLPAGTATANTAPLKFTSGTNLTTTEAGAVEYNGANVTISRTNGGARIQLDNDPLLNFTASGTGAATTISIPHGVAGVSSTSVVMVGARNAASAGISYWTSDATNINIVYTVAPANGTNNLSYSIQIKP